MKKLITMTIMVLAVAVAMAQAPEKFTYQAVVRNASNQLVANAPVGVRVSILQGDASGNAVYVETHTATTNTNGLLTIEIGGGSNPQGTFVDIDWANGPFFLKTETDPNGGSDYSVASTQQLLSVPYALYSKEAGNGFSGDYNDLTNRPQIPQTVGELTNDANYITMDSVPTNVSAFNNDAAYITLEQVPAQVNADWNATTGAAEILNKPVIPTVPTDVSAFNNDVGYITGCVETDPQFNAWDKDYNDLINTPDIPTVPTDVSTFTNDAHYVSNAACEDVDLCALAAALAQLQALVEEQQQRIEELESQIGTDTTTTPTDTTTVTNGIPCPGTPTVTDYDGNVYNTVLIGNQCWIKENLRTTHYADGTLIPAGGDNTSDTEPYYYDYSSHSLPLETRGYLYNLPAAMHGAASSGTVPSGVQGVCPSGWHLPSDAEWTVLTDYVSSQPEYTCDGYSSYIAKALASTEGWNTSTNICAVGNDQSANNTTGFSAVPAGSWTVDVFVEAGDAAHFWTSTETHDYSGEYYSYFSRELNKGMTYSLGRFSFLYSISEGFSVRCLRDDGGTDTTQTTLPTVITGAVSDITETTANCGGEVTADGGAAVTERGVCWSTSATPTVADAHTSDGTGTGTFTSSITGLTANTTYYVRAYATNSVGTGYGEVVTFSTEATTPAGDGQPCPGTPTVTDHEGNVYNTVQIGDQCWMRDNLRTTTSPSTGTYLIPASSANYTYTGKQASWYNNDSATYAPMNYGLLYNWNAAIDTFNTDYGETSVNTDYNNAVSVTFSGHRRGICPVGWHLPSHAEWSQLTYYVGVNYACGGGYNNAKALASTTWWLNDEYSDDPCYVGYDPSTNNASGFGAVPAGYRYYGFSNPGYYAGFWSSTEDGSDRAYYRHLYYNFADMPCGSHSKHLGFSVRCLRDEGGTDTTQTTPAGEGQPCPGAATVTDYDGNVYNTVQIGDQCWMRENLRVTHYSDGTPILAGGDNDSFTTPYYYNNNSSFPLSERGYIYNWPAAMHGAASSSAVPSGVQGVCPTGWHLPSDAEWTVLEDYVGNIPEYQCGCSKYAKALTSTTGWNVSTNNCAPGNDQSTNNASGFGAVPAGYWLYEFNSAGYKASFWSSTEADSYSAYYYYLNYDSPSGGLDEENNFLGHSVRCLRNEGGTDTTQTTLPTVITGAVSNITETTATCGGEVTADGGAAVTERGVCWSISATPTIADAHTSDGTGTGTFTSSITGLTANTTYYVRAYAINSVGTGYGEVVTFTTEAATPAGDGQPCPGTPTVTDHEGNVYNTVQIGHQCWMRDNLRTTTSPRTGTYLIPPAGTDYTYTGKQACWYNNDSATYAPMNYGLLYNWNAAVDTFNAAYGETSVDTDYTHAQWVRFTGYRRGICPMGWHLPSDAEWNTMEATVGGSDWQTYYETIDYLHTGFHAGKLAGGDNWTSSTTSGAPGDYGNAYRNISGFSAVPAGYCYGSSFGGAGYSADFWSATQYDYYDANSRHLNYNIAGVYRPRSLYKHNGFSVRCLRDEGGTDTSQTTPGQPCTDAVTVTDYDGNVYNTVQIGNQCWTRENLRVTHYSDGTSIPAGGDILSYTDPYYYDYSSSDIPLSERGYLYNWPAAMHGAASSTAVPSGVQGVCPTGWHLPSDAEWTVLTGYVGANFACGGDSYNNANAKALASTTWWLNDEYCYDPCCVGYDPSTNNASGFEAVPADAYRGHGFEGAGYSAFFWSATQYSSTNADYHILDYSNAYVGRGGSYRSNGFSVRCIRN